MRWIAFNLLLVIGLGLGALAWADESVELHVDGWAAILDTEGISEADRHQALVALRAQAAGLLDEPETKKATLYPGDPMAPVILEALARASLAAGDRFSAHVSLSRLVDSKLAEHNPELAVEAADAAAGFGNFAATLEWIRRIDLSKLSAAGRLQPVVAGRYLEWLIDEHGDTMEAHNARLRLLELDDAPIKVSQIDSYIGLIRNADDVVTGRQSAERFAERWVDSQTARCAKVVSADPPRSHS